MTCKEFAKENQIWEFKKYTLLRWIAFVGAILFVWQSLMFFCLFRDPAFSDHENLFLIIWFRWFQYFTIQSNILVGIYQIWYWIRPKQKCLNGNFLIAVTVYITVTFIGFSCILFPAMIATGDQINTWNGSIWIVNLLQHFATPISAFVFFIVYCVKFRKDFQVKPNKKEYWTFVGKGMIYPCIYCIYAMVLPFIAKASVYGQFTNLNPQLVIYGRAGSALALVVFIPALCLFFGLLCGYKAIFKKVNKENNGKNITR